MQRVDGHQDGARVCHLFHPRGEVRGLSHRRVVHAQVGADGADDDFAGVQADADPNGNTLRPPQLVGVLFDRLLHPEARIARPHRVILVRQWRAEQGHDAVAHHLIDRALVVVDGVHHVREDRVQDLARLLGIAVGEQLHRALEIGEQDGDLLAFPF